MSSDAVNALVDAATDAIVTADSQGRILSWNAAAERTFGYSSVEVLGQPLTILIPERFRADHVAGIARVTAGGERHVIGRTVELVAVRRGGSEFPIELSRSTWESGGQRYYAGIIREITERTRLVNELSESEARLSAILRSANDAVVCADELGIVTLWNEAAARILGYTEEEVVGRPLTMVIPDRFQDRHNAGILRMRRGEAPRIIGQTVEISALHKSGSEVPVELSLATWTHGGARFYSGILRDISLRR